MLTFESLLDEYFFFKHLRPRSERSYQNAMAQLEKQMVPQGIVSADDLTLQHILKWRKTALMTMKAVSWNSYVRHLRAFYNFGIEHKHLAILKNPFKGVMIREPRKPKKTLSKNQIQETRNALQKMVEEEKSIDRSLVTPAWFWHTVNETFFYTGLRVAQIIEIKAHDINFEHMTIQARAEGSKTLREYPVPIAKKLKPFLVTLLAKAREAGINDDEQLFNVNRFSQHYRRETMNHWQVSAAYRKLSRIIESKVSPHRHRHTLATDLMTEHERNIKNVKDLLGHTSIKTTLEYVTADMETMRGCVDCR